MNTNTTTRPALPVVWPTSTFWPPDPNALKRAHAQLSAAKESIVVQRPGDAIPRIESVRNLLAFFLTCHPEPFPKGPADVS